MKNYRSITKPCTAHQLAAALLKLQLLFFAGCLEGVDPETLPPQEGTAAAAAEAPAGIFSEVQTPLGECPALIDTPPRGLACLHCLQPEAAPQAAAIVELLRKSCLRNVAINYVVDGSFSYSEAVLLEHAARLSEGGREALLIFYLTNGPWQRQWEHHSGTALGTKVPPETFRQDIAANATMQEEYRSLVTRLFPIFDYALSRNIRLYVLPALEDNLTDEAFSVLLELTVSALGPYAPAVRLGRNPCPNCYRGNEFDIPPGLFFEFHTINPAFAVSGGIISNDGMDYAFTQSEADSRGLPALTELAALRDAAGRQNNIFVLWTAIYQGRDAGTDSFSNFLPPNARTYPLPSGEQEAQLIDFLRGGAAAAPSSAL